MMMNAFMELKVSFYTIANHSQGLNENGLKLFSLMQQQVIQKKLLYLKGHLVDLLVLASQRSTLAYSNTTV